MLSKLGELNSHIKPRSKCDSKCNLLGLTVFVERSGVGDVSVSWERLGRGLGLAVTRRLLAMVMMVLLIVMGGRTLVRATCAFLLDAVLAVYNVVVLRDGSVARVAAASARDSVVQLPDQQIVLMDHLSTSVLRHCVLLPGQLLHRLHVVQLHLRAVLRQAVDAELRDERVHVLGDHRLEVLLELAVILGELVVRFPTHLLQVLRGWVAERKKTRWVAERVVRSILANDIFSCKPKYISVLSYLFSNLFRASVMSTVCIIIKTNRLPIAFDRLCTTGNALPSYTS